MLRAHALNPGLSVFWRERLPAGPPPLPLTAKVENGLCWKSNHMYQQAAAFLFVFHYVCDAYFFIFFPSDYLSERARSFYFFI